MLSLVAHAIGYKMIVGTYNTVNVRCMWEVASSSSSVADIGGCHTIDAQIRMATDRVWGGYPRVLGSTGLSLGMVFNPRFSGSGPRNQSSSVSGLVFHPWISNGYPK